MNTNCCEDIKGYEQYYAITPNGQIWSKRKSRFLKPILNNTGYWAISLCDATTQRGFLIHRLVAITYLPNPHSLPEVNHKNGVKTDASVENLEWCTPSQNNKHAFATGLNTSVGERNGNSRLNDDSVRQMLDLYRKGEPAKRLASEFKVSETHVYAITSGRKWKHLNQPKLI